MPVYLCIYTNEKDMHRGSYIKNKIKEQGFSVEDVLVGAGLSRSTIYKFFENENLPYAKMKRIADVIKLDLTKDFPETKLMYQEEKPTDYRILYLNELEKNRSLELQLAECKEKLYK